MAAKPVSSAGRGVYASALHPLLASIAAAGDSGSDSPATPARVCTAKPDERVQPALVRHRTPISLNAWSHVVREDCVLVGMAVTADPARPFHPSLLLLALA